MSTGVRWSPMAGSPPWAARSTRRSDRADVPVSAPILDLATADALMALALDEARAAPAHGDVPIGAVVARIADGEVLARRHNERELLGDPTAHAEVLALRDAAVALDSWRLDGCGLVGTPQP